MNPANLRRKRDIILHLTIYQKKKNQEVGLILGVHRDVVVLRHRRLVLRHR